MSELDRSRTEQKLRFARLHLDELASRPSGQGDDFERAHYEAALAQLLGAYEAFLGELNVALGCNRKPGDVSLGKLRESLKGQGRSSHVLRRLYDLQQDERSRFRHLQDLRHASIHRRGVPLAFHLGGPKHRRVSFKHPATLDEQDTPADETLREWLKSMRRLIDEARELVLEERAG